MIRRALGALLAAGVLFGTAPAAHAAAVNSTTQAPRHWDPRVREFVRFVEKDRNLLFDHPVAVAFLDDAAFLQALDAGDEPTRQDRADAAHDAARLRAAGMIGPGVDLLGAQGGIDDTTTTGFYDPDTKKLYVRGKDLTDTDIRLTVVHELTHALQDQHFDLNRLDAKVRDSGQGFAEDALIEGDATTVENDYFFSLPKREQGAYNNNDNGAGDAPAPADATAATADAPVLAAFDAAPYDYGAQLVSFVVDDRGTKAVDALFRTLPRSEEQVIDPVATHRREKPVAVAAPELAADEQPIGDPDVWGAYSLYMMLAPRIDRATALEAANGWGGDASRAFTRADGTECVRVAIKGDTTRDTEEIGAALALWAVQMPGGGAASAVAAGTATFTACDVGGVTSPEQSRVDDASNLLYDRNHFAAGLVADGVPYARARCAAGRMALDPEVVAIEWAENQPTDTQQQLYDARRQQYERACRV